jgi:murein DD-endopeptidase MepM/ murein hydrolase activator NlpD
MMTFSCLNLLLDVVNVMCFARAKHLMGYNTEDTKGGKEVQKYGVIGANDGLTGDDDGVHYEYEIHPENGIDEEGNEHVDSEENDDGDDRVNLNMCSAYTVSFLSGQYCTIS